MLLIIALCIFREEKLFSEKAKRMNFIWALVPVFILIAFKAETVGTDTISYLSSYKSARDFGMDSLSDFGFDRIEPGYTLLLWILARIHADEQFLSVITGLIVAYSLYKYIWQNASNRCMALYLFVTMGFFQFAMSGIRQTIAICISMLAYKYIKERKLFYFLGAIALASTFHKSVVVFLPIYYFANMEITRKKIAIMFTSMLILLFVAEKLILSVADVMDYNYGVENTDNGYIFFAIVLLITYLATKRRVRLIVSNKYNKMIINTNFISLSLWTLRLVSRTAERVSLYFMPYTYLAFEEFISTQPVSRKLKYQIITVIFFAALFIKRMLGQEDLSNYKFFFQL